MVENHGPEFSKKYPTAKITDLASLNRHVCHNSTETRKLCLQITKRQPNITGIYANYNFLKNKFSIHMGSKFFLADIISKFVV